MEPSTMYSSRVVSNWETSVSSVAVSDISVPSPCAEPASPRPALNVHRLIGAHIQIEQVIEGVGCALQKLVSQIHKPARPGNFRADVPGERVGSSHDRHRLVEPSNRPH